MKKTWRARIYRLGYPFYKIYRFIFRPRNVGASCVIENQNKILLIRNTYGSGLWNFPGGGIKKNENPYDAMVREIKEEVGIDILSGKKIGELWFDANNYNDTIHAFSAEVKNPEFKIDPNEILEGKWFLISEVPLLKMSMVGKKIWEAFLKNEENKTV